MSDQKDEIKARDEQAEEFEDWYLQKGYYYDWIEKKTILNALNLQREDVVLDVGCGTGRFAREISRKCNKVYGIDFSPKSIEVLNKKTQEEGIKNIEPYVCDITKPLPIKEKVDKIVSFQVIQHIPTDAGRFMALRNLYDHLKRGGVCVISVYNWRPHVNREFLKEGKFPNGIYYLRFTPNEVEGLFRKCGFKDISVRGCINFRGYGILNGHKFYKLFYPVTKLDTYLSRFRFSCSLGNFLVCRGIK
jgi:SAM-dependent methyltransferase